MIKRCFLRLVRGQQVKIERMESATRHGLQHRAHHTSHFHSLQYTSNNMMPTCQATQPDSPHQRQPDARWWLEDTRDGL
ncbi:hypothetical protein Pmani_034678 [Petrolisthes manimaculis]|nr:hypothetical protein Pmani_034678 [Petrolisthes manimaculis]